LSLVSPISGCVSSTNEYKLFVARASLLAFLMHLGCCDVLRGCERIFLKGLRVTATELFAANVPFKIITDSMAAWTMKTHRVDAILVGADQVAMNGDTANKIGTYMLAVLAKYHNVPFYAVVVIWNQTCL
uniref:S-methyl-5-thioribose-1-phosphate isomerase n=1 Tax=Heligmosomoides polygyrus TaxID=6339 RepID=A0A183GS61_HELPZ